MLLPLLIPKQLAHYEIAENSVILLAMLISKREDFAVFFESACEDETWSNQNPDFMQNSLIWLTDQFCQGNLPIELAKEYAKSIRSHFQIISSCLPRDTLFIAEKKEFPANSLLVATSSDVFYQLIKLHGFDKTSTLIKMKDVSAFVLRHLLEFMETGNVADLWKFDQNEMVLLLRQASTFELSSLMELCEACLKHYLNEANVIATLKTAHEERWWHLQQSCFDLINNYKYGIILRSEKPSEFGIEFSEFNESSLSIFDALKMLTTHLICSSSLTENPIFNVIIRKSPKLISLDISRTRDFSEYLYNIPESVQELDLSMCGWLTDFNLKRIVEIFPNLSRLRLASNIGITYQGWGELQKIVKLTALDISHCSQINDEDFLILLSSCKGLEELYLEACKKLSEKSFFELAHKQPALTVLNLARTNVSDAALIEVASRCTHLVFFDLSRCKDLTERGVIQAVKYLFLLRHLKFERGNISLNAENEIKKLRPKIVFSK